MTSAELIHSAHDLGTRAADVARSAAPPTVEVLRVAALALVAFVGIMARLVRVVVLLVTLLVLSVALLVTLCLAVAAGSMTPWIHQVMTLSALQGTWAAVRRCGRGLLHCFTREVEIDAPTHPAPRARASRTRAATGGQAGHPGGPGRGGDPAASPPRPRVRPIGAARPVRARLGG